MKDWYFVRNVFLSRTEKSYKTGMEVSTFHYNALAAVKNDPLFLGLYNSYGPFHLAYKTAYEVWKSHEGVQQGETLSLNQLMKLLAGTKIQQWDIKIQNVYTSGTPQYKKLLPGRRKPFQTGGQIQRINTVNALSLAIGADEKLADVKADVDTFHKQLEDAYSVQKGSMTTASNLTNSMEEARRNMCVAQYGNLGALIQKYAATPEKIVQYFDMENLREDQQVIFRGTLKPMEVYNIVKHTFGIDDQVVLINRANTKLKFYLAAEKNMAPNTVFAELDKGKQIIVASALGDLSKPFLMVQNTDPNYEGQFSIEIV